MSYNYVTVSWKYETDSDNTAAVGRVEWYPTDSIMDSSNNEELDIAPVNTILDTTGAFSVSLLATDNTNLSAFGWTFVPFVTGQDATPVSYYVPYADGAAQELDSLTVYEG